MIPPIAFLYKNLTRNVFLDILGSGNSKTTKTPASHTDSYFSSATTEKEKLIAAFRVSQAKRKRKAGLLATAGSDDEDDAVDVTFASKSRIIAVTLRKGTKIRIHKLKADKSSASFTIQKTFALDELKSIENEEGLSVTLNFAGKSYEWTAETTDDKNALLLTLVHLSLHHTASSAVSSGAEAQKKGPTILNTTIELLRESVKFSETPNDIENILAYVDDVLNVGKRTKTNEEPGDFLPENHDLDSYQQGIDLDEILTDFNAASDAAALELRLKQELQALEAANIYAIIQSDVPASDAVEKMDIALKDLELVDDWITRYIHLLESMGQDVHQIEIQNKGLQIIANNQRILKEEVLKILNTMKLPTFVVDVLRNETLSSNDGITACEESLDILMKVIHTDMGDYNDMDAVNERISQFNGYANQFANRMITYLLTHFNALSDLCAERQKAVKKSLILRTNAHEVMEERLIKFRSLFIWLKMFKERKWEELQNHYLAEMNKLLGREVREFMEFIKSNVVKSAAEINYVFSIVSKRENNIGLMNALVDMSKSRTRNPSRTDSIEDKEEDRKRKTFFDRLKGAGSTIPESTEDRLTPEDAFETFLIRVTAFVVRFHNFYGELFSFDIVLDMSDKLSGFLQLKEPVSGDALNKIQPAYAVQAFQKRVQELLGRAFDTLSEDLIQLVDYIIAMDPTFIVCITARLEEHIALLAGSRYAFLGSVLETSLKKALFSFSKFISEQIKDIEETKVISKKRTGILTFARVFPLFVERIEDSIGSFEAPMTEKAISDGYAQIFQCIMETLEAVALEAQNEAKATTDDKDQLNIHILIVENMHYFHTQMESKHAHGIDVFAAQAKELYLNNLSLYSKAVIRRVLGRLQEFFEGIEDLLKTGAPQEVSFHLQYNRTALKEVLKKFPAKTIKKGLEALFKRVEKHYAEDYDHLSGVIWKGIQEEFMTKIKRFQELISLCYPDTSVALEFTADEIRASFRELFIDFN